MIGFVDLARQYHALRPQIDAAIAGTLERTSFILGEPVARFEAEFAAYCGARFAVGVGNGTDALEIALESMGIGPGDEVIVPANTFIATALAVANVGATVVPADVDPRTKLLTVATIEPRLSTRTKAVAAVHLFGTPVELDELLAFCAERRLLVLEDAAQAHGARYRGRRVGTFGTAGAFSFYPGKNLGAYGDGGAIVTDDADLATRARLRRDLGQERKYVHVAKGRNSRLDALQAGILSAKLPHLDVWNARRRELAALYDARFAASPVETLAQTSGESVRHLYCIAIDDRDAVTAALDRERIGYGIHYPTPIHLHGAFPELHELRGTMPVAERWAERALSLPLFAELTDDEAHRVADAVLSVTSR